MTSPLSWEDRLVGKNCPLCADKIKNNPALIHIADLGVSSLYLDTTSPYHGYCQLVYNKGHLAGMEGLSTEEFKIFADDIKKSMDAVYVICKPDHMNYAALGNMVPHLHFHLIPRYLDDPAWGTAIWATPTQPDSNRKPLSADESRELAEKIRKQIAL